MRPTIGVIGLGSIGMRHAKNFLYLGCEVYGTDPDATRLDAFADAGGKEPLIISKVDGLVIASPTHEHFNQIMLARYGAPDVPILVEKPIGDMRFTDCPRKGIFVGYNLRYHACVRAVKEAIELEPPAWGTFTCGQFNEKPAYRRDGVILNWSHEIDLALYLLGPAKVVGSSTGLVNGQDVMTDILLLHENGSRSTVHLDYLMDPQERHFTIQSDHNQRIKADLVGNVVAWIDGESTSIDRYDNTFDQNYLDEANDFLDFIKLGTPGRLATAADGLAVLDICLTVRQQAGL